MSRTWPDFKVPTKRREFLHSFVCLLKVGLAFSGILSMSFLYLIFITTKGTYLLNAYVKVCQGIDIHDAYDYTLYKHLGFYDNRVPDVHRTQSGKD